MVLPLALIAAATFKVGGGLMAYGEAMDQAKIAAEETEENAKIAAESVKSQISKNYVEFAKSGVALEGSPLFTIDKNIETGKKNVENIFRTGKANVNKIISAGRSALFNSIGSAASGFATGS